MSIAHHDNLFFLFPVKITTTKSLINMPDHLKSDRPRNELSMIQFDFAFWPGRTIISYTTVRPCDIVALDMYVQSGSLIMNHQGTKKSVHNRDISY